MTELEKIERAKMYMDKLANGINPIDGTMAPDDSHMAHGNWNDGMRAHTRRKAYEKANENWRRNRHFRGRTNEQQRTLSGCRLQQCRAAFYHRQSGCNSHSREYADRDARRSMDERS